MRPTRKSKSRANGMIALVLAFGMVFALAAPAASAGVKSAAWYDGATVCASLAPDGTVGDDDSRNPRISDDGRYVAFESRAGDLHPDDDVDNADGDLDVFVRDLASGVTTIVSGPREGASDNARGSRDPDITDDGRYVSFLTGQDLVEEDTNGGQDIYVFDMAGGSYHLLDPYGDGTAVGNGTDHIRISGDGSVVVFATYASISPEDSGGRQDIYLYSLASDEVTLVTGDRAGASDNDRGSRTCRVSDDGRYVYFVTGQDLVADDTNGGQDLYVKDMQDGSYHRADLRGDGSSAIGTDLWEYEISGDGMIAVFDTWQDLSDGEDAGGRDVYLYDFGSDDTTLVSEPRAGGSTGRGSRSASASDDGRLVVFLTGLDLVPGDTNNKADFYLWDRVSDIYVLINATYYPGTSPQDDDTERLHMAGSGTAFAWESDLPWFVPGDDNDEDDVFVRALYRVPTEGSTRFAGADRYATSAEISAEAFPNGARTVVIATGAGWPDALGGSALAGAVGGPILLTRPDALPSSVKAEIVRLGATSAYILGGTKAVSSAVELELNAMLSGPVKRLAGADRFATSGIVADRAIAEMGTRYGGGAFFATGASYADAAGASPLASGLGWPIYLVNPTTGLQPYSSKVTRAVILGGPGAVSGDVMTQLQSDLTTAAVDRVFGPTRYDTSADIAQFGVDNGLLWSGVGIASGKSFPDALAGGSALGMQRSVMLLTDPSALSAPAATKLNDNKASIASVRLLGGPGALSAAVETQVNTILGF